jgi:hypothetical protein
VPEITTIGLDIANQVFHAHGADSSGATVFSRRITRAKLLAFFALQPRCTVAMEACARAHHWGRELPKFGHEVRLIVPAYAARRGAPRGSWLEQMMARKPRMLVTVALANKTARIVWALLASEEDYRAPVATA